MAIQKIELKVNIHGQACKMNLLKTVAKLQGIDEMSVDSTKEILTIVGEVDPVLVTTQLRKNGMFAQIITVGPPKTESKTPEPESKKPHEPSCCYPQSCPCYRCQVIYVPVQYHPPCDDGNACSIM